MDRQGHVVAQGLAPARQIHLPVEAELVAVDDGLEVDPEPVVLVGSRSRAGDLAAGDDRLGDALDGQLAVDDDLVAVPGDLASTRR